MEKMNFFLFFYIYLYIAVWKPHASIQFALVTHTPLPPSNSAHPFNAPSSQLHVLSLLCNPGSPISAAHMFMNVRVIHWSVGHLLMFTP